MSRWRKREAAKLAAQRTTSAAATTCKPLRAPRRSAASPPNAPAEATTSSATQTCGGTLGVEGSSNMKSASGDLSRWTPHAPATSADTPSDSASDTETDLSENETGLFNAF
jgi:hypothetical protein